MLSTGEFQVSESLACAAYRQRVTEVAAFPQNPGEPEFTPYEMYSHMVDVYELKVTASGQISLPAALRRRWNVAEVLIIDKGDYALVRPVPSDPVAELRGLLPADGQPSESHRTDERNLEADLEEERWSSSTQ